MLQQRPGDLLEVFEGGEYYYLLVITKGIFFGGNIVYAFHYSGRGLDEFDQLTKEQITGFNSVVDLIHPKRENRVKRVARIPDYERYLKTKYFKGTHTLSGRASEWWIYDLNHKLVARTSKPTEEMKAGMNNACYSFTSLARLIKDGYFPGSDSRL